MHGVEATIAPRGPYRLRLMVRSGAWSTRLPGGGVAEACQQSDGRLVIRASDEESLATARFMLALDDDTSEFHRRFARDPLLGAAARAHVGFRPLRRATVAAAVLHAMCGQLIDARRAAAIERAITRATGGPVATQEALARFAPAELRRLGLAQHRATGLSHLVRTLEFESLRDHPTDVVRARLMRERAIGPWSVGVIATEGLGRYDHAKLGDLELVKLAASLWGYWPEPHETGVLLEPYGEWQGLACEILLRSWTRGLVPGTDRDFARANRRLRGGDGRNRPALRARPG